MTTRSLHSWSEETRSADHAGAVPVSVPVAIKTRTHIWDFSTILIQKTKESLAGIKAQRVSSLACATQSPAVVSVPNVIAPLLFGRRSGLQRSPFPIIPKIPMILSFREPAPLLLNLVLAMTEARPRRSSSSTRVRSTSTRVRSTRSADHVGAVPVSAPVARMVHTVRRDMAKSPDQI